VNIRLRCSMHADVLLAFQFGSAQANVYAVGIRSNRLCALACA